MIPPRARAGLVVLALLAAGTPARAAELDPYLPADTETFVSINVRQLLDSSLVKKFGLGPARNALKGLDEVEGVLKDLDFDPFKDLDRLVLATPSGKETDRGLIVAYGKFNLAK